MRDTWEIQTETKLRGSLVSPGTELTFRDRTGRRIRAKFVESVCTPGGASWLTALEIDRSTGRGFCWRSFSESSVLTVHRISKARPVRKGRK